MNEDFVTADSDPSTCMPFVVHLKEPRFFAMVMPKLRSVEATGDLADDMNPASAVRGLNLYPAFLTDPRDYDQAHVLELLQEGARQFWESMMGPENKPLEDAEIAVVLREESNFVPPHLFGSDGEQSYIIRTQSPRMIWRLDGESVRECAWRESCSDVEFAQGTAAAFSFYQKYLEQEGEE